jgi:hypothetical protein
MDKLYRKHVLPSGRVRYIESYEWDTGDPAEGLWVVRRGGQSKTWLADKVADLPSVKPEGAWVAGQVHEIANAVHDATNHQRWTAMDVALAVVNALMREV